MTNASGAAPLMLDTGRTFYRGASGRWAGERLLKALKEGRPISPAELKSLDTLRKDEWKAIDDALIEEGAIRLKGVADLIAAGLTIPVMNALGKTLQEYEKITDMADAIVSLSGVDRGEDDRVDFSLDSIPLPITHKDFDLNIRTLTASRERGESLDTTQSRVSGRKVAEMLEYMLFNGGKTFGGKTIYGYTTHPDRNVIDFATAGEGWAAAGKTGEEMLTDVLNIKRVAEGDRFFGPYRLYLPGNYSTVIDADFKANSDKSIRQRIREVDGIQDIRVVDQLASDNVVLVQFTRDVAALVDGESLQSVQWDIEGGFVIKFKAFAIQVPLIRSTSTLKTATTYAVGSSATATKCGVVHLRAA